MKEQDAQKLKDASEALAPADTESQPQVKNFGVDFTGLMGGGFDSGSNDSDVDRPVLSEADKRRRENKQRSKVKPKPTAEQLEEFKRISE